MQTEMKLKQFWRVVICCVTFCIGANSAFSAEAAPAAPSEKEITQWIADLASEDFATREKAQKGLTDAGQAAVPALKAVIEKTADAEVKQRATELVKRVKDKDGWVTLPSGVKYKVLTEGKGGNPPNATDSVTTHYVGTLLDGTEFDSSRKRGEPATFPLNGVIAGWTEVLQLMPIGSKWTVQIPPEKAYGERGMPSIPPNSTLVFEIELIAVQKN
jgi:FKBP-type peptidyl-prolyl cis-trans isomerase FklB